MTESTVKLQIPFQSLVDAIASLGIEEKHRLWEILEEEMAQQEEDLLESDPRVKAEIEEARLAYQKGDYQTIDQYIAHRSGKNQ